MKIENEFIKLGEVAKFFKGKGLPKSELVENAKSPCIHYGELFTKYGQRITEIKSFTNLSGNLVYSKSNDVLMPTSDVTPNGLATASAIYEEGVILGGDILITRIPSDVVNGVYLAYFIKYSKSEVLRLVTGSTVYHIYGKDLAKFKLFCPPIFEQKKIAEILSTIDEKIEAIDQRIAETQELKKGLIQQLLTKGIGHTKFKDSPLGEIPESWEVFNVEDVFDFVATKSLSRAQLSYELGTVYYVHYGDIHSTFKYPLVDLNDTELPRILPEIEMSGNIQYLINGDLILADASEDLEGVGICIEIHNISNRKVIGGLHTIVLRDKIGRTANGFRTYLLSSPLTLPFIKRIATGASVLGVSKGNLKNIEVVLPPIPEQQKIAEILSSVDQKLQIQQDKKAEYQELKKGLMQQLLTGKIRVKVNPN
ncbi:restriction endonuclease subunit S [Gelidibacter japonicus]|uniref:restriction endonuclease subunit S n=1 Tax=Gelidibacter japonicus TaxID=1962232 RepID=UPI003A91235A